MLPEKQSGEKKAKELWGQSKRDSGETQENTVLLFNVFYSDE